MKFSVLMSVYAKEDFKFLDTSLESIFNQTLKPSQVVLVKDGKLTKELDSVISKYSKKLTIVSLPKNKGLALALNAGLKKCKYKYVARMDSDDICVKTRFEKQIKFLEKHKDIDILGSSIKEFDKKPGDIKSVRRVETKHQDIVNFARYRSPFNHMTVIFNKNKIGSYRRKYGFLEDYDLWYRAIQNGLKLANLKESLVQVRIGNNMQKKRSGIDYLRNEFNFQKKMLEDGFTNPIDFILNLVIRLPFRILPNEITSKMYMWFLRNVK